ncbi:MAG TPA: hypothetical protein VIS96_17355 [Terrimicrobiaceae bacterium]
MDTNLLLHPLNDEDVAVSEFILAELYGLLRNPPIVKQPLDAARLFKSTPPPALATDRFSA